MAMPLEEKIMQEIGLNNHYNWYNGSGSCVHIRNAAADKLSEVIYANQRNEAGKLQIALPNQKIIKIVKMIAESYESSNSSLTNTWKVASEAIATHIHAATMEPDDRPAYFAKIEKYLQQHYSLANYESQTPRASSWGCSR
jgi:hypothetical protein